MARFPSAVMFALFIHAFVRFLRGRVGSYKSSRNRLRKSAEEKKKSQNRHSIYYTLIYQYGMHFEVLAMFC